MTQVNKQDWYRRIQVASTLSLIPLILFTGPFSGYVVGAYLEKKFGLAAYITIICIALGFCGSIIEVVRIIKFVTRVDKLKR